MCPSSGLQLDFEPRGRGLAGAMPPQVTLEQLGEIRMDELGERAPEQGRGIRSTAELREARVGERDAVALDRHAPRASTRAAGA